MYQSEIAKNPQKPVWSDLALEMGELTGGNATCHVTFQVWDLPKVNGTKEVLLGQVTLAFDSLNQENCQHQLSIFRDSDITGVSRGQQDRAFLRILNFQVFGCVVRGLNLSHVTCCPILLQQNQLFLEVDTYSCTISFLFR